MFIINHYLVRYKDAIVYLTPLIGITIITCLMNICVIPFMKACRKEKEMLFSGVLGLICNIIISTPLYLMLKSVLCVAYASFIMMLVEYVYQSVVLHKELEVKKMPTGGRTFTVKSALATGETIAVPMDTDAKENKTGKRLPKIVFNKEGTSI